MSSRTGHENRILELVSFPSRLLESGLEYLANLRQWACFLMQKCGFASLKSGAGNTKRPRLRGGGAGDPIGSVAAAARPDQAETLFAFDLDQRGVDRNRKARIIELDREIFAVAVADGLLPGGAELGFMRCTA